jgi:hypothetical protein
MINNSADEMDIRGCTFIKGLLTETSSFYNFVDNLVKFNPGKADLQVKGARGYYKNPLFERLLINLQPSIERLTGYRLFKTYSYLRIYHTREELFAHIDRLACEITVSICIDNENRPWPLWVRGRDGVDHSFEMTAGDAVIFRGTELQHWRKENTFGNCTYVFLHYVNQFGPYADQKDDMQNKKCSHY